MENYDHLLLSSQFGQKGMQLQQNQQQNPLQYQQEHQAQQDLFSFTGNSVGSNQKYLQSQNQQMNYLYGQQQIQDQNQQQHQHHQQGQYDYNVEEEEKQRRIKYDLNGINERMLQYGLECFEEMLGAGTEQVIKNLTQVYRLIQKIQQGQQNYGDLHQKMQMVDREYKQLCNQLEKCVQEKKGVEKQLKVLENRYDLDKENWDLEKKKLDQSRGEAIKSFNQIQKTEQQWQKELSKKDQQIQELKEKLNKELNKPQNTTQQMKNIQISGKNLGGKVLELNSDEQKKQMSQFPQMVSRQYDQVVEKLVEENKMLSEGLMNIHKEMGEILATRKECYLRKKRINLGQEEEFGQTMEIDNELNEIGMIPFKKELFSMGAGVNKNALELLNRNIFKFKEAMDKIDQMQTPLDIEFGGNQEQEIDKIQALGNLRKVLEYYKQVILQQNELLNKAILKSNDFITPGELSLSTNRFTRVLDEQDIEQAKNFINEQKKYLEEKSKEIDVTKKVMTKTMNKIQEDRDSIIKKREEFIQRSQQFKENMKNIVNQVDNYNNAPSNYYQQSPGQMEIYQ